MCKQKCICLHFCLQETVLCCWLWLEHAIPIFPCVLTVRQHTKRCCDRTWLCNGMFERSDTVWFWRVGPAFLLFSNELCYENLLCTHLQRKLNVKRDYCFQMEELAAEIRVFLLCLELFHANRSNGHSKQLVQWQGKSENKKLFCENCQLSTNIQSEWSSWSFFI